jgi:hypothetical protein
MSVGLALGLLVVLVVLTVRAEFRRARSPTALALAAIGNLMYVAVAPSLYHYSPENALIFEAYLYEAGLAVTDAGLTRVLLAGSLFQGVCLAVSMGSTGPQEARQPRAIDDPFVLRAASLWGWALVGVGLLGALWMGLKYNGSPLGLYQIAYVERAELARTYYVQFFLLIIGQYGAAQLVAAYLLAHQPGRAALLLLGVTLHGLGMKSKFPIFWVVLVFVLVAVTQRGRVLRRLVPIGVSVVVLSTMSFLRGFEKLSELPEYVPAYWDLIWGTAIRPWDNDLPGPASIVYFVLNSGAASFSLRPVTEVLWLLVPRFIYERGPVLADVWAKRMIGAGWEPGQGLGWSPLCEGYLLAGWAGIALVALAFALIARKIDRLGTSAGEHHDFFVIVAFCSAPFFLLGLRESTGGLIKGLLTAAVVVWVPTFYLTRRARQSSDARSKRAPAGGRTTDGEGEPAIH